MRASAILETFARAAVIEHDRLAGHRMRVMEGDRVGRGPEPRLGIHERVGPQRVLWVAGGVHGNEVDGSLWPSFGEGAVPEGVIAQRPDLPDPAFAHVLVLVHTAFPP